MSTKISALRRSSSASRCWAAGAGHEPGAGPVDAAGLRRISGGLVWRGISENGGREHQSFAAELHQLAFVFWRLPIPGFVRLLCPGDQGRTAFGTLSHGVAGLYLDAFMVPPVFP